ncbi:MAG: Fic family protein [Weissella hellenica]|uniref:Fic family protein n=1 Tax=Weissella hellenica TaxID=46256 RepID=UPI00388B27DA
MAKYKLLKQYIYTVDDKSLPKNIIADQEYRRRIDGYSTIMTQMRPKIMNDEEKSTTTYPIFFVETVRINELISKMYRHSKQIILLEDILPGVAKTSFINTLLINEIHDTNEIEGVDTNREEIGTIIGNNKKNTKTKRLVSTVNLYIDTISEKSKKIFQLKDFRTIYDELLQGEIIDKEKPDGRYFRNGFVRIGNSLETVYIPPVKEEEIFTALTSLIDFMNSHKVDPILKALVTHFMFENTHPFYDGNGRMGRYLLSSYISSKVDIYSGLSIATAIRKHSDKYYRTFKQADDMFNRGDLTIFLEDMLTILVSGQQDVIQDLRGKKEKLDTIKHNLAQQGQFSDLDKGILFIISQSQLFNIVDSTSIKDNEIVAIINKRKVAVNSIKGAIKDLTSNGILVEISKNPLKHVINKKTWHELLI